MSYQFTSFSSKSKNLTLPPTSVVTIYPSVVVKVEIAFSCIFTIFIALYSKDDAEFPFIHTIIFPQLEAVSILLEKGSKID